MRTRFALLLVAVALAIATGAIAATTSANTAVNPNIRDRTGGLTAQRLSTFPQLCEIYISDGTGETITTPTTATVIKSATLSLVSAVRGSMVADGPNGTCKTTKPGLYEVCAGIGDGVGDNTAIETLDVFRKDGAGAAAVISPKIRAKSIALTANLWVPLRQCGLVRVTADEAAATGGVVFDGRITADTGSPEIKEYRLTVKKIDELDPAAN